MKIKLQSYFFKKLKMLFYKSYHYLENNGNHHFDKNGEEAFLNDLLQKKENQELIIFDIGANVGKWAEIIQQKCKKSNIHYHLHLFEPTQGCIEILEKKFSGNELINLNRFGVSDTAQKQTIFYDQSTSGLASLYQRDLKNYHIELKMEEEIELRRLDNYIEEKEIPHIHLLKIDVEGHELKAFQGLGKFLDAKFIDIVQFEYGGTNIDAGTHLKQFFDLFEHADFQLFKIMRDYVEPRTYHLNMENFNYANYLAISNVYLGASIK